MEDIRLSDFTNYFSNTKKIYQRIFLMGLFLCVIITYFITPRHESHTTFVPQSSANSLGALDYTSKSLGLNLGSFSEGSSPILNTRTYPIILTSHSFLDKILDEKFESEQYGEESLRTILYKYANISTEDDLEAKNDAYELLTKKLINVKTDNINSSVTITLSFYEKKLVTEMLNRILENLKEFQNNLLQKKAKDKSKYLEETIVIKKEQLANAEVLLQKFLEANKTQTSPALLVGKERLERNLRAAENIYILLTGQLEMSKVEEIENLNRVHIISTPSEPFENHYPSYIINIIFFLLFFLLVSFCMAMLNIRVFDKS